MELPVQNKINSNFIGDCIVTRSTSLSSKAIVLQFHRPCEGILCYECIFAKSLTSHTEGLKALNEYK
jgi:hypothetical protein